MNTIIKPYPDPPLPLTDACTPRASSVTLAIVPLLIWTAGTGGLVTAQSTAEVRNRFNYYPRIHIEPSITKPVDVLSPSEHIKNIRDVFSINMSDLASVLDVSRPTVYAWLGGKEPKKEAIMRIQELSRIADEFKQADIIRLDKLVHRPILNGCSLLDKLKTNEDPTEALTTLKMIAGQEAKTRPKQKGIGKHRRSLNDVLNESSVAIYPS